MLATYFNHLVITWSDFTVYTFSNVYWFLLQVYLHSISTIYYFHPLFIAKWVKNSSASLLTSFHTVSVTTYCLVFRCCSCLNMLDYQLGFFFQISWAALKSFLRGSYRNSILILVLQHYPHSSQVTLTHIHILLSRTWFLLVYRGTCRDTCTNIRGYICCGGRLS